MQADVQFIDDEIQCFYVGCKCNAVLPNVSLVLQLYSVLRVIKEDLDFKYRKKKWIFGFKILKLRSTCSNHDPT